MFLGVVTVFIWKVKLESKITVNVHATKCGMGPSAMRMPMHCCHKDIKICAYRLGGWV